jgi:outer membrane biosynthesis protein TonB
LLKKGFWLALGGLVACGGAAGPQPAPITVTATAPESSQQAQPAAAPVAGAAPDGGAAPPAEPASASTSPDPQARSGPVTITGRLSPEEIQSKMVPRMPSFTACYKDALAENPTVTGTLRLRIVIDTNGQVATANVTAPSTIKNDKMSRCVLKIVRSTPFPRPAQGTVEAMYSIVFAN